MRGQLAEAAMVLGMSGSLVFGATFAATRFTAVVEADLQEHARREAAGLRAVLSHELLQALSLLPDRRPVRWTELDPLVATVLDVAPLGVVETTREFVRKVWRPALVVTGVLVADKRPSAGLDAASLFAPDARRALVLGSDSVPGKIIDEAKEIGVGLVWARPDRCQILAEATARPSVDKSPRHWRFLETVYDRWLVTGTYSSAHTVR
jgi:hypothetical protein